MSVRVDSRGWVAVVTIDDPRSANALTSATVDGLLAALGRAADEGARCIVLTGASKTFCAGGDLDTLRRWHAWDPHARKTYLETGPHAVTRAIRDSGFASVAAVNGAAYGAGMDIALSCDVRIASHRARFCEAYVNVGLVPGDGGAWLLPRVVGHGRALELLLSGRVVDAPEALEWGIVTRVVDPEDLLDASIEIAGRLASRPPQAQRLTRELVHDATTQSWEEHLDAVATAMAAVGGSKEHRNALSEGALGGGR